MVDVFERLRIMGFSKVSEDTEWWEECVRRLDSSHDYSGVFFLPLDRFFVRPPPNVATDTLMYCIARNDD